MKPQSLTIESRTERLISVREFVSTAARKFGFSDEEVGKIALAVDEACTNVIKHAYSYEPDKPITVIVSGEGSAFEIAIRDQGMQFDPALIPTPNMKEYLTHYRKGGLGVHLMRSLMDKVVYSIKPGKPNEVRLIKYRTR